MTIVMIVVEIVSALLAPAAEVLAPLFILFAEVLFWLILIFFELMVALYRWRRPKVPSKPVLSNIRNRLKSFSASWRNKRESKKSCKKSS